MQVVCYTVIKISLIYSTSRISSYLMVTSNCTKWHIFCLRWASE